MTESEFNPIAIYNHLVNLRIKPQSGGKNANGEAQLISNLRIDMASVLKEVNRHRACDAGTCFYCREWALLIYKKTYNARNHGQNANGNDVNSTVEAENKKPKEAATEICQQYYDFINKYGEKIKLGSTNEIETNLVDSIIQKTFTWIKSPNSLYAPPNLFTPVEFDTPQQALVYSKQENDILSAIEIEKSNLVIQKDSFPFLKNINKIQKCGHTRPDWKNPSDLDLDRRVFNDKLLKEAHKNEEILAENLSQVWLYVNNFLTSMLQLEERRDLIFGKGCATKLSSFMKEYQDECLPFNDYWAPIAEAYKKSSKSKKGNANLANVVDDIDTAFCTYINNARTVISLWEEGFVEKIFNDAIQFGEETQRSLTSLIVESKERIVNGRVQKFHSNIITKCSDASRTAKDIKLLISKRMSILRTEITTKNKEFVQELEVLEDSYKNESQKTLQGRLEKANNKEFRKRIKKFENAVQGFRQYAINSIGNFFSVTEFTDICTRCLEILMMEGEMWEAIQLGRNYKNYEAMSQKLESQRQQILKYYNDGVETGRFVLSGIIGRLFLKEAQRQQDETLALEKQESFLQSMKQEPGKKKKDQGQSTTELVEPESPKKKKNKKRKNTVDKEMNSESNNDTKKQEQFIRDMIEKDDPFDIFKFANSETISTSSPQSYSTSNSKPKETTESYSTSNSKTKQTTESYSTSNSKPKETTESYSTSNSKPKQTTESYSTSNSKPKQTTESYSTSNSKPKQTTESYSTSNSKPKQTTESYSTSNSKPKQTTESYSTSNSKPKETTESYSTSNSKPKQTTESYSTSNSKSKETTESYSTSNSKPKETTERQLSIPPGLNPPGDTYSQPSPNDDSSLPNGNQDDASKLNLDVLNRSDLIMLIQNLSTEKTQLVNTMILMQQEVKAMTVRYANLMEMARDRELQIETRKQQELEEAKKYIQTLELRISHLEKQNIVSNGNSGSTSPKSGSSPESPIGTSSTSQILQPSGFNLFPTNRTGPSPLIGSKKYLNPWRSSTSGSGHMRCGNCGDQGHVSQECTVGCRYCGNSGHLSENCDSSNYNFAGGSGSKENGIKC